MDYLNILAITMPFILGGGIAESAKLKNRPLHISLIVAVAAVCFVGEYFAYQFIGFPQWMRWIAGDRATAADHFENARPTALTEPETRSEAEIDALYKVDDAGWMRKKTPDGYVYQCVPCQNQVEVTILVSKEFDAVSINKYKELEAELSDEKFAREWVVETMQRKSPTKDAKIDVERTEMGDFFNIKMIQYMVTVDMTQMTFHETGFIGLHQSRLVSVTLNYLDGSMDDTANKAITHLFSSLLFVPMAATALPKP